MSRGRQLVRMNRMLVRQERLSERELAKALKAVGDDVANRFHPGFSRDLPDIVMTAAPEIAKLLERRMLQTALMFGKVTLQRVSGGKSYYPGLPEGTGPLRGRDYLGLEWKEAEGIFERTVRAFISSYAIERARTVLATFREATRAVLLDVEAEGLGEAEATRRVRSSLGGTVSKVNAARIARTEMHNASTYGADEAARSTGLEMVKEWLSAEDARTRESHAEADGQEVGIDEAFIVGGYEMDRPGDPGAPASEVVNCRCAILHHAVIGGEVIRG